MKTVRTEQKLASFCSNNKSNVPLKSKENIEQDRPLKSSIQSGIILVSQYT
jgi:hypothetical protein